MDSDEFRQAISKATDVPLKYLGSGPSTGEIIDRYGEIRPDPRRCRECDQPLAISTAGWAHCQNESCTAFLHSMRWHTRYTD